MLSKLKCLTFIRKHMEESRKCRRAKMRDFWMSCFSMGFVSKLNVPSSYGQPQSVAALIEEKWDEILSCRTAISLISQLWTRIRGLHCIRKSIRIIFDRLRSVNHVCRVQKTLSRVLPTPPQGKSLNDRCMILKQKLMINGRKNLNSCYLDVFQGICQSSLIIRQATRDSNTNNLTYLVTSIGDLTRLKVSQVAHVQIFASYRQFMGVCKLFQPGELLWPIGILTGEAPSGISNPDVDRYKSIFSNHEQTNLISIIWQLNSKCGKTLIEGLREILQKAWDEFW